MNAEAAELLRRFAVEIDVRRPLMEFSTAIQQMVAIARAVSFKAQLVIMDEPTSSLDEREVAVLFDVMRRLRAEGVAVIFVSHRLDELYQVCDRVTVMRDGRTVTTSRMADIDKLHLVAAMLGRDLETVRAHSTGFSAARAARGRRRAVGRRASDRPQGARRARRGARAARSSASPACSAPAEPKSARAIFGADPPDAGTIRLGGRDGLAAGAGRSDRARRRLLQRGPQGRRHRARHVGAREPDARASCRA